MADPADDFTYAAVLRGRREAKGRRVREVWVEWAMEQSDPKPSWLAPFDDLTEPEKEVDRRIGSVLWGDGYMRGFESGLAYAHELMVAANRGCVAGCDPSQCDHSSTGGCCDVCGGAK